MFWGSGEFRVPGFGFRGLGSVGFRVQGVVFETAYAGFLKLLWRPWVLFNGVMEQRQTGLQ